MTDSDFWWRKSGVCGKNAAPNGAPNPPILVDAWSNPIIYVPPSGLSGVTVAGDTNRIVTSHRVRGPYGGSESLEPGASGFWASAGPDGDFWLVSFGAGFSAHSCRLGPAN